MDVKTLVMVDAHHVRAAPLVVDVVPFVRQLVQIHLLEQVAVRVTQLVLDVRVLVKEDVHLLATRGVAIAVVVDVLQIVIVTVRLAV